jgi:NAD(P) transhydrogenase
MLRVESLVPKAKEYDYVVLGSGPGGQRAAVQAAKLGKSVLVIERDKIGGSCLHSGTIPSKTLREAALESNTANCLDTIMARTHAVIGDESVIIAQQLARNSVEFVTGTGAFVSPHEIAIANSKGCFQVRGEKIVIATGTRPRRPRDVVFDNECIFDSDTILQMTEQPKTMAVIGAGVIGCEYVSIYARMGVEMTLIDNRNEMLRSIDEELVSALKKQFEKSKIILQLGCDFSKVERIETASRMPAVRMFIKTDAGVEEQVYDAVLYCMGRMGNSESLNLEALGMVADERGLLSVNSNYQTRIPHIYAVGDIIGLPALAASAVEQGRLAALHALTGQEGHFPQTFPYGIYTIPEISSVGAQEAELKERGTDYVVGRALYRELARGKILDDEHGFVKILVDTKTEKILGVHVIGTGATELVHIGQVAMAFGAKIDFFLENVFNYPTLAEAYRVAAFSAINQLRSSQGLRSNLKDVIG